MVVAHLTNLIQSSVSEQECDTSKTRTAQPEENTRTN